MLPIVIDRNSSIPVSTQVVSSIRDFVAMGSLKAGEAVPSTRSLAAQLGVARGTVVAAYDQLVAESYLVANPGGKTTVHQQAATLNQAEDAAANSRSMAGIRGPESEREDSKQQQTLQFDALAHTELSSTLSGYRQSGAAELDATILDLRPRSRRSVIVTDSGWREAWRSAAQFESVSGINAVQGLERLRRAIAEHLRLMRSMVVDPDDIFVTTGAREGLFQTLHALGGSAKVGVEAPGYPGLKRVISRTSADSVDVQVDELGVVVSAIDNVDAVLVTPNHLYPVGGSMPAPRRHELLAAAAQQGFVVIEDDLDSEYRHVGPVMPSLWELAPEVVVHLGTFAQVLTSDARIGYVIAPRALHGELLSLRQELGSSPSPIAQRAIASYLESGGLRRQITKRRRDLSRRKAMVTQRLPSLSLHLNSGALAVIETADAAAASQVISLCAEQGVLLDDLSEYWGIDSAGIALGYGEVEIDQLQFGLEVVSQAISQVNAI